jgi:choline-glycine betaine transporter
MGAGKGPRRSQESIDFSIVFFMSSWVGLKDGVASRSSIRDEMARILILLIFIFFLLLLKDTQFSYYELRAMSFFYSLIL